MPLVVALLTTAALASLGWSLVNWGPVDFWLAGMLALLAIGTERIEFGVGSLTVSGGFIPAIIACVLVPHLAIPIGLAAAINSYPSLRSRIANTGISVLACAAGATAAQLFIGDSVGATMTAASAATVAFIATNSLLVGTYLVHTRTTGPHEVATQLGASFVATSLFFAPAAGVLCLGVLELGIWALPTIFAPLALTQYFYSLYHRKVQLTEELAEKAQVLARTNLQFAAAMVKALDARDAYTAGHSAAVAVYTRDIARELGFDDEVVRMAHLSGLLHDIGKIGVPGRVLNKTAPLDDEEYELMKSHAAMGAEILGEVDLYADIATLVRYHHERIDGRGYPDGIAGDAIPAISRMISVADTYSAMTTDRPYRDGMPTEKAMSILRECRGTQLDSDFTDAFLRILIVADEAYQRGKQTDFEVEVAKHQALSEVEAEAVRLNEPAPAGPEAPAAPQLPMLPAAVDGELIEVDLEREAA